MAKFIANGHMGGRLPPGAVVLAAAPEAWFGRVAHLTENVRGKTARHGVRVTAAKGVGVKRGMQIEVDAATVALLSKAEFTRLDPPEAEAAAPAVAEGEPAAPPAVTPPPEGPAATPAEAAPAEGAGA